MKPRSNTLLIILLLGLLAGLVLLVTHHDEGEIAGMSTDQFGRLVVLLSIGIFIGAGMWGRMRGQLSQSLIAIIFWLVIALLIGLAYSYRDLLPQFSSLAPVAELLLA
ncbi:hypothetical protein ACT6QG_00555 [Xanthobacter sp. TB0136]|uniref:hypothetical protein n=1 Tax=Xanthobacter sp. TB0136 TaxID=3459177 RepID=UPI0040398FA0